MLGQRVKLPHMGALACLLTLVLFLRPGPWQLGVLERILVAAAAAASSRPEVLQVSQVESSLTVS